MPTSLRLENDKYTLPLNQVETSDYGVQATSGMTGLGLPPVQVQWVQGAGDGARGRGRRILPRPLDIPIFMRAANEDDLRAYASSLAKMFAGELRLVFVENRDSEWHVPAWREGGGDWVYGEDTDGSKFARTVVTVTAGDPYWTSASEQIVSVENKAAIGLLTGSLSGLHVSSAQAIGKVLLSNDGDVDAKPIWEIHGPGTHFTATSEAGEVLDWVSASSARGPLRVGDVLTIDTAAGTAIDQNGVDCYDGFSARPRMWSIPEGGSTAQLFLQDAVVNQSKVVCRWRARRWVSI